MSTVQTYLGKWEEKQISTTPFPKFWEKIRERREKWCDGCEREKKNFGYETYCHNSISAMKRMDESFWIVAIKLNCGNKKLNCGN